MEHPARREPSSRTLCAPPATETEGPPDAYYTHGTTSRHASQFPGMLSTGLNKHTSCHDMQKDCAPTRSDSTPTDPSAINALAEVNAGAPSALCPLDAVAERPERAAVHHPTTPRASTLHRALPREPLSAHHLLPQSALKGYSESLRQLTVGAFRLVSSIDHEH